MNRDCRITEMRVLFWNEDPFSVWMVRLFERKRKNDIMSLVLTITSSEYSRKKNSTHLNAGNALAFFLVEDERVDHGGDYERIHKKTVDFVRKVRASGLDMCVFWDGDQKNQLKDLTRQKRDTERTTSREKLLSAVLEKMSHVASHQKYFPVPPLFAMQVRATLLRENVRQISCYGEADPCIAFQVREINDKLEYKAYVLISFIQITRKHNFEHQQVRTWSRFRFCNVQRCSVHFVLDADVREKSRCNL